MTLRWTRISKRSKVAVPLPHGDFRVVTLRCFVGSGIGPRMTTPALFVISRISSMTEVSGSISILFSLIRTFAIRMSGQSGF